MVLEILIGIFGLILTALGTILIMQFKEMKGSVKTMSENIADLNVKIAGIIKDQGWHKNEINEIKERLNSLERKG
jgi:hypothetical protein